MPSIKELTPYTDFIMLEPVAEESVTKSGLIIPDNASKEKPRVGKILAVGPHVYSLDPKTQEPVYDIKVGDYVVFSPYTGEKVEINVDATNVKRYHFIRQDALIAQADYDESN